MLIGRPCNGLKSLMRWVESFQWSDSLAMTSNFQLHSEIQPSDLDWQWNLRATWKSTWHRKISSSSTQRHSTNSTLQLLFAGSMERAESGTSPPPPSTQHPHRSRVSFSFRFHPKVHSDRLSLNKIPFSVKLKSILHFVCVFSHRTLSHWFRIKIDNDKIEFNVKIHWTKNFSRDLHQNGN